MTTQIQHFAERFHKIKMEYRSPKTKKCEYDEKSILAKPKLNDLLATIKTTPYPYSIANSELIAALINEIRAEINRIERNAMKNDSK